MKPIFFLAFFGLLLAPAAAQNLPYDQTIDWVLNNHPLAAAADAVEQRGAAELMKFRGALDPKLSVNYDRKDFKGTEYFDYGEAAVEWQSPFAVKVAGGYQRAEGTYLNAERTIPSAGQGYLALKLPLLRGLMTDATRIGLKRGELAVDRQRALADVIRNELRYDLAVRYLQWTFAVEVLDLNREMETTIAERLANYRVLLQQGDKAEVDTLEASVYLGTQQQMVRQAEIDLVLAQQAVAEMYWPMTEGEVPVTLPAEFLVNLPAPGTVESHPEIRQLALSLADASLSRDLKREQLKPELNLSYYLLGDGFALPEMDASPFAEAYKFGLTASYPILNRKARAGAQLGELKVLESEAKLGAKTQALFTKAGAYYGASRQYLQQLNSGEILANQAAQLLAAERELYDLGESTQFVLNQREQALLKARMDVAKLRLSRAKAVATYRYLRAVW
ncbi:TolC family protein [Neolewinella persica]|uniref:TolC family protein n=1 Tax=Neolewinella persica TaxID=70998 RepID=UPI00037FA794|nr:TolC family protein [Neolewinella persica]